MAQGLNHRLNRKAGSYKPSPVRGRSLPSKIAVAPLFRDGELPAPPGTVNKFLPRDALIYSMRWYLGQAMEEIKKNEAADPKVVANWLGRAERVAADVAPYCHAKLIQARIDEKREVTHQHAVDLSGLTDHELEVLKGVRVKLDAAVRGVSPGEHEAFPGSSG